MAQNKRNPAFGVNDYNEPKVLSEKESLVADIMMILFGKPGFYPSIPTLGMDLSQYMYDFDDEVSVDTLKDQLAEQCGELVDDIQSGDLDVVATEYKGNLMFIFVLPIIDDTKQVQLTLAVTTNDAGQIVYNFVEAEPQII